MTNIHSECEKTLNTKFGTAKINKELGYYQITTSIQGNYGKYLHRLIYETFYKMKIPKGFIVHHKDGNKLNNCILNLQLMKRSEHMKMHNSGENHYNYGGKLSEEHKIKIGNSRRGIGHTDEAKQKIGNALKKDYARIVKHGISPQGKQNYVIKYDGKIIKSSIKPQKLINWFKNEYPNEEIKEEGL